MAELAAALEEIEQLTTERDAWRALAEHEHAAECAVLKDPAKAARGYWCDCGFNIAEDLRAQLVAMTAARDEACDIYRDAHGLFAWSGDERIAELRKVGSK